MVGVYDRLSFAPLPPNHDRTTYFGVAMANWALNYSTRNRPLDCWYVVRLRMVHNTPEWYVPAGYKHILGRYRHYTGRLFTHDEAVPVVNALNHRPLSVLAASATTGGLSKYIHDVSRELEVGQGENIHDAIDRILKGEG